MRPFPLIGRRRLGATTVVATPVKLNLFLELVARRDDGYHDLETLFLALATGDALAIAPAAGEEDTLVVRGLDAPTDRSNLVLCALERARATRPVPALAITLRKRYPMGTGLGAGSGDAAGMLAFLHDAFPDPRGAEGVLDDAAHLGSDIAFFLGEHAAAIGRGRGERLAPFPGRLFGGASIAFVIAMPAVHSSTARAFARMSFPLTDPGGPISVPTRTFEDSGDWQRGVFNRLEGVVVATEPRLSRFVEHLREHFDTTRPRASRVRPTVEADGPPDEGASDRAPTSSEGTPSPTSPGSSTLPRATAVVRAGMTGSGSAFFLATEGPDRARCLHAARRLEAALRAPGGALERYTAETGVPVLTRCALPHSLLAPR